MHEPGAGAVREVAACLLDRLAASLVELCLAALGPPADGSGDVAAAATRQQSEQAVADPGLGLRRAATEERPSSEPQVLEHVHHIEDERDLDAGTLRLGLHGLELPGLPVDENDPTAAALGVATEGLFKWLANHLARGLLDARPPALVLGARAFRLGVLVAQHVQHVGRRALPWRDRVHRADLCHPLPVRLLPG